MKELNSCNTKLWKRILCIVLSVIMGLGTFVTLTFGNFLLSDWIDIREAFAATSISAVPVFYRHGELVGLYRVDYTADTTIQYKIGDDGEWTDYTVPFSIPAHQTTKVYARIGEDGTATYMNLSTTDEALGVYEESNTDFEFSYNNIYFGYTRTYNSVDKDWFESVHSKVLVTNSRLEVYLPDGSQYPMIRKDDTTYVDELNGYTLTKTDDNYIFEDGQYKYYFAIKTLSSIAYLSAIEDYNGNVLNLTRTTSSDEISISDGAGRSFYILDYYGIEAPDGSDVNYYSVKEITDPNGNKLQYTTKLGRYIEVKDQAGVTLGEYEYASEAYDYTLIKSNGNTIDYYDNGRLKQITYQNGSWIKYTYDDDNMSYTTLTSDNEATKTVYNDAFLTVEYTDEYGDVTTYTYDDHYRVLTETCGDTTTTYTYDSMGNVISYITGDAESNTYYTYDSNKRVVREQVGDSYTYYTYDSNGNNLVCATLSEDYTTEVPALYDSTLTCFDTIVYTYDENGRILTETYSSGENYAYEYDEVGNVIKETCTTTENDETKTTVTTYTYDDLGNILTTGCENDTSSYIYDAAGRTLLANENGECTRTLYDDLGRTVQEISSEDYDSEKDGLPDENTYSDSSAGHTYVYNETTGNLDSETNRLGVTTTYTYNDVGNKMQECFDIYEYNYNAHGDLLSTKVSGTTTVSYEYDESYNLITESYANGDFIRYEYDDDNNLVRQYHNDETSAYVTYSYDEDNELIQKVNTDTGLKYVYGEDNEVSVYNISDGTLVQSYTETVTEADEDNDIEAQTDVTETHFGTTYSSVIKDSSISYTTDSNTIEYSYQSDDDGNITSDCVTNGESTALSSTYTYDDDGNATEKAVSYYIKNQEATITAVNSYDDYGKIVGSGYNDVLTNYIYEENDEIIRVNNGYEDSYTSVYEYDERGNVVIKEIYNYTQKNNITSLLRERVDFTYSTNGWNDLLVAVNDDELTYDANGNVLTYSDKEFTWNTGRNLESITDGDNTYSYTYDENGIRTSKTVNGTTTYYNTKDGVILSQTDGTNTMYFQYDTNGVPLGFIWNGTQYLYMTNQMGDVITITEENGNIIAEYNYDEWGSLTAIYTVDNNKELLEIANANPIRYRGYYYDNETGYYYLQSRYYDPSICRFINADLHMISNVTKDVYAGTNLFSYCNNNPINNCDSDGHFTLVVVAGVSISVGTVAAIVAIFSFALLYATNLTFRNAVDSVVYMLVNKTITAIKLFATALTSVVKVARNSRKYDSNEKHHIVAQKDSRASSSRKILKKYDIGLNDSCNLVSISKTLHKHLHTDKYHKSVYSVLVGADKGNNKTVKKYKIQGTLMFIGFALKSAGKLCK